jgi:hypothetical protein
MTYRTHRDEELPKNCSPEEATLPEKAYFRLGAILSDNSDFWSQVRLTRLKLKIVRV